MLGRKRAQVAAEKLPQAKKQHTLERKPPAQEDAEKLKQAKGLIERFWGLSTDGSEKNVTYGGLESALGDLNLTPKQLRRLRLELPETEVQGGTTQARIRRCEKLLMILEDGV